MDQAKVLAFVRAQEPVDAGKVAEEFNVSPAEAESFLDTLVRMELLECVTDAGKTYST